MKFVPNNASAFETVVKLVTDGDERAPAVAPAVAAK
jgi:hypothetical protein